MTTISTKLTALGVALMFNGMMIGVAAYLFNGQFHPHAALTALANTVGTMVGAV